MNEGIACRYPVVEGEYTTLTYGIVDPARLVWESDGARLGLFDTDVDAVYEMLDALAHDLARSHPPGVPNSPAQEWRERSGPWYVHVSANAPFVIIGSEHRSHHVEISLAALPRLRADWCRWRATGSPHPALAARANPGFAAALGARG